MAGVSVASVGSRRTAAREARSLAPRLDRYANTSTAGVGLVVGLVVLGLAFLVGTGFTWGQATASILVVGLQGLAGSLVVRAVLPRETHEPFVLVGLGLAFGTGLAILTGLAPWPVALRRWAWLVVVAAVVVAAVARLRWSPSRSGTSEPARAGDPLRALLVVVAGLWTALPIALDHPLKWDGWWRFHKDYQFHESVASSVHYLGWNDTLWFVGQPLRYHWFVHLWVGGITEAVGLPPFAALTRLTFLVGVVGSVLLAWAIARSLTASRWAPPVAAAAAVAGTYVGVPLSVGSTIGAAAPTQAMGSIWLLGGVYLALLALRASGPRTGVVVGLAVMSFLATGAKVNHGVVLVGGLVIVALLSGLGRVREVRASSAFLVATASVVGGAGAFLVAIWGTSGGLTLGFNSAFAGAVGLSIGSGWIAVVTGVVLAMLAVGTRWVGLAMAAERGTTQLRPVGALALGAAVTGLVTTFAFVQTARSQDHFALSATMVLAVLSAALVIPRVEDAVSGTRARGAAGPPARPDPSMMLGAVVVLGAAGGLGGTAWFYLARAGRVPSGTTWIGVLLPWLVGITVVAAVRTHALPHGRQSKVALLGAVVLASSIAAGLLYPLQLLPALASETREAGPVEPGARLGVHPDHLEAAAWLFENSSEGDLVATNRLCSSPTHQPPNCLSRWYLGSAASRRPFLVEGFMYGVRKQDGILSESVVEIPELARRLELSRAVALSPDDETVKALLDEGVTWYWLDRRADHSPALELSLPVAFANDEVALLQLR